MVQLGGQITVDPRVNWCWSGALLLGLGNWVEPEVSAWLGRFSHAGTGRRAERTDDITYPPFPIRELQSQLVLLPRYSVLHVPAYLSVKLRFSVPSTDLSTSPY